MQKIRTIRKAAAEIRKQDPDTAITEYFIRQLVSTGEIPSIKSNSKSMINMQDLYNYIGGGNGMS